MTRCKRLLAGLLLVPVLALAAVYAAIAGAEQILMREVDRKAHDEILAQVSARL